MKEKGKNEKEIIYPMCKYCEHNWIYVGILVKDVNKNRNYNGYCKLNCQPHFNEDWCEKFNPKEELVKLEKQFKQEDELTQGITDNKKRLDNVEKRFDTIWKKVKKIKVLAHDNEGYALILARRIADIQNRLDKIEDLATENENDVIKLEKRSDKVEDLYHNKKDDKYKRPDDATVVNLVEFFGYIADLLKQQDKKENEEIE